MSTMGLRFHERAIWATAAILVAGIAVGLTPRPAQAAPVILGEIDVTQAPYSANTTGAADDTAAFQRALNAAANTGAQVRVPAGQYKFAGSISIPAYVVLEGVNDGERSYAGYMNGTASGDVVASKGTVFLVNGSRGKSDGPSFLTLNSNSALRNITIYYPQQTSSVAPGWKAPTAYPPTISLLGHNASVENVCGINPYLFIASSGVGSIIRRVTGQPLSVGISTDNDAGPAGQSGAQIEDVHFVTTWDSHARMTQWMKTHSAGFRTCRADEIAMRNCSCMGYQYGFSFNRSRAGTAYGTLTSCSALHCSQDVRITACTAGDGGGLVFDGGGFGDADDCAAFLANTNQGTVTFNSCRFFQSPRGLVTNASAAGSVVSLLACSFDNWCTSVSGPSSSVPCVFCGDAADPKEARGKTRILSCNFGVDQYQYTYTPGEASVFFSSNSTVNGIRVQVPAGAAPPSPDGPNYVQINNF